MSPSPTSPLLLPASTTFETSSLGSSSPPSNTNIEALQQCVDIVSSRPPNAQARFVYELNALGLDGYHRTWSAEHPFRRSASVDALPLYSPPPPPYQSPPPPYEPTTQTTPSTRAGTALDRSTHSAHTRPRSAPIGSRPSAVRPLLARAPVPSRPSRIDQGYARPQPRRPSPSSASRRANRLVGSSADVPIELDSSEDDSPPPRRSSTYSITPAHGSNQYNPRPPRVDSSRNSVNLGSSSTRTNLRTRPDLSGGDGSATRPYDLSLQGDDGE
jgi:hypothetical protein